MLNLVIWNITDYLYKMDLALNNLQKLICHKNQPTNQPTEPTQPIGRRNPEGTLQKEIISSNYRLITCLSMKWKILFAQEEI